MCFAFSEYWAARGWKSNQNLDATSDWASEDCSIVVLLVSKYGSSTETIVEIRVQTPYFKSMQSKHIQGPTSRSMMVIYVTVQSAE